MKSPSWSKPYNPYQSQVVLASAGTGKTFQLSQRFLFLVGSGADPASILTVTFTNKAAQEMRARILRAAMDLLENAVARSEFDNELGRFYSQACQRQGSAMQTTLPPPMTAEASAHRLLNASQRLKITTIDSLFLSWMEKFPLESSFHQGKIPIAAARLADASVMEKIHQSVMQKLFLVDENASAATEADNSNASEVAWHAELLNWLKSEGVFTLMREIAPLLKSESFLWYLHKLAKKPLLFPALPGANFVASESDLFEQINKPMQDICEVLANPERFKLALQSHRLQQLRECGLITENFTVSGRFLKGEKKQRLSAEVSMVEQALAEFVNGPRLQHLHNKAQFLLTLASRFLSLSQNAKQKLGVLEFSDLGKGAFQLFYNDEAAGARYLIHRGIRHLMLDEFQDTSRLQWLVFRSIAEELLAGDADYQQSALTPASLFIVGDVKQSIYGFREAEPQVLIEASQCFADQGVLTTSMEHSYRSAQVVLDTVNSYFKHFPMAHFKEHAAAKVDDRSVTPDVGEVLLLEPFCAGDNDESEVEQEARFLATAIRQSLDQPENRLVYDKSSKSLRPLTPRDICLLYREGTHAHVYEQALHQHGVPCQREEQRGFFTRQEISDLMALIKFVALPFDLLSLSNVLRSPMAMVTEEALSAILMATKSEPDQHMRCIMVLKQCMQQGSTDLQPLLRLAAGRRTDSAPASALQDLMRQMKIIDRYQQIFPQNEAAIAVANLIKFIELAYSWQRQQCNSWSDLLRKAEQVSSEDTSGSAKDDVNAVTLMTMHKSKGLEFPWVIIVNSARDWYKRDHYWLKFTGEEAQAGFAFIGKRDQQPLRYAPLEELLANARHQSDEEIDRLIYVAMTRARQYLWVSGVIKNSKKSEDGDEDSRFFYHRLKKAITHHNQNLLSEEEIFGRNATVFRGQESHLKATPSPKKVSFGEDLQKTTILPSPHLLPSETVLVLAHAQTSLTSKDVAPATSANEELEGRSSPFAKIEGLFLHAGLEKYVKGEVFLPWQTWVQLLANETQIEASTDSDLAYDQSLQLLSGLLATDIWRNLLAAYAEHYAEVTILHYQHGEDQSGDANKLLSGKIDLLLRNPGVECLIVDYKAGYQLAQMANDDELRDLIKKSGFSAQVQAYAEAVQKIYPSETVKAAIYVLRAGKLVDIKID